MSQEKVFVSPKCLKLSGTTSDIPEFLDNTVFIKFRAALMELLDINKTGHSQGLHWEVPKVIFEN